MARIRATDAAVREAQVWGWFMAPLPMTVKQANEALAQTELGAMNLNRIYELKRAAVAGQPFPARTKEKVA